MLVIIAHFARVLENCMGLGEHDPSFKLLQMRLFEILGRIVLGVHPLLTNL